MDFEAETPSLVQVLQALAKPAQRRDHRAVRLAAVTSAIVEVIPECTASNVYAKVVTALEGTLTSKGTADSLPTQTALLELLSTVVPYVEPRAILVATLPLTSRVLRAIVSYAQGIGDEVTKDELGGVNATLRWTCRASSQILKYLGSSSIDEKAAKQLLLCTLVALFDDRRPKVRKAAQEAVLEVLRAREMGFGCHSVITKTITSYVDSNLVTAKKSPNVDHFNRLLHLVPFVERSILFLNFTKLGTDIMELLIVLMQIDASSLNDFVVNAKVHEMAPKVMTIGGLLSIVATMLGDESEERKQTLDQFTPRVLATLLQVNVSLVFRHGAAEYEVQEKARIQFGQVLLTALRRVTDTNNELACKLFPLTVKMVVLLSRPQDEAQNDATVAEALFVELTQVFRTSLPSVIGASPSSLPNCLEDVLRQSEQVLLPVFKLTWSVSLKCLAVLLQSIHGIVPVNKSVEKIIGLGKHVPLGSPVKQAVEDALSTLVQGVGVEQCWSWIKFDSNEKKEGTCTLAILDVIAHIVFVNIALSLLYTQYGRNKSGSSMDSSGSQSCCSFCTAFTAPPRIFSNGSAWSG